jgi:hypothetical protein
MTFEGPTSAAANIPPPSHKRFWRRYIYLWIEYAVSVELTQIDMDRAARVCQACLDAIPDNSSAVFFSKGVGPLCETGNS